MSIRNGVFFSFLLCAVAVGAHAATVFEEDFQDNFNDTIDNANDDFQQMTRVSVASTGQNADWHIFDFSGNVFARVNGFGADVASDDWLITPALNLTGATSAAVEFDSAYNFTGPTLELKVSTNYNPGVNPAPSSATWTPLTFTEPSTGSYTFGGSGVVNLTPYISSATYVAWRYTSTGVASGESRVWELDNIVVYTDGVQTGGEGEGEGVVEGEGEGAVEGEGESVGEGDMIISEYIEGSSNNKAIEIFNGKTTSESLTGYTLALFSNGSPTATVEVDLTTYAASLPARGTLVIANSSANGAILALADGTCAFPDCPITYNGNDAVALYKNGTAIDVVGVIGQDPGTAWVSGAVSTQNQTLRRKSFVCSGNPDGFATLSTLAFEWNTFAIDTTNGLGSHVIDCTLTPEGEPEGATEGEGEPEGTLDCTEVFSEDFESNFNSTTNNDLDNFEDMLRVSVASTGNEANWHIFGSGGGQFARINGFGADVASDDWLITPALNLGDYASAILTFDSAYNFGGPALQVLVSNNYNPAVHTNPGTAAWTALNPTLPTVSGYVFASSGNVILSTVGPNTRVAFRYTTNGTAGGDGRVWEVDNIAVCGQPEPPAGPATSLSYILELDESRCLEVPNPGTATDGDFSWSFTPQGGSTPTPLAETGRSYCIVGAQYSDAGTYRATYEDGATKSLVTFVFYVSVVENLPVGGMLGLSTVAALLASAGALGLRRRK